MSLWYDVRALEMQANAQAKSIERYQAQVEELTALVEAQRERLTKQGDTIADYQRKTEALQLLRSMWRSM